MKFSAKIIVTIISLLVLIIASGLYTTHILSKDSQRLVKSINEIEYLVQDNELEKANNLVDELQKDWLKTSRIWSMLIDHIEVDNIQTSLTRTAKYIKLEEEDDALAEISVLRQFIEHIVKKEKLTLENIF